MTLTVLVGEEINWDDPYVKTDFECSTMNWTHQGAATNSLVALAPVAGLTLTLTETLTANLCRRIRGGRHLGHFRCARARVGATAVGPTHPDMYIIMLYMLFEHFR